MIVERTTSHKPTPLHLPVPNGNVPSMLLQDAEYTGLV